MLFNKLQLYLNMKKYKKFTLPSGSYFIIEVLGIGDSWEIDGKECGCIHGIVVHSPQEIWPVGYESDRWGISRFEDCSKFVIEVDLDNEMWIVNDLDDLEKENYFGGYFFDGTHNNEYVIEWDSDLPSDEEEVEEIEKLLIEYISNGNKQ